MYNTLFNMEILCKEAMMEIQGSSLTSLQNKLVALIKGSGSPSSKLSQGREAVEQKPFVPNDNYTQKYDNNKLREEMLELSKKLQEEMQKAKTNIDFTYNDEIQGLVVTVRDSTGSKIIREIPSPEAIELMHKMRTMIGNIFDERV